MSFSLEAAFTQCAAWRKEMLAYVQGNVDFVCRFLAERIPGIVAVRPQASFLIWLDCRGLGLNQGQLVRLFVDKARLALNDGALFGPGGEGFMRLNIGTPRAVLEQALRQLKQAVENL